VTSQHNRQVAAGRWSQPAQHCISGHSTDRG